MCISMYVYVYMYICKYVYMCICVYVYMSCICVYLSVYTCICLYQENVFGRPNAVEHDHHSEACETCTPSVKRTQLL